MKYLAVTKPYQHNRQDINSYGSDVVEVEAPTRAKAKAMALRAFRKMRSGPVEEATNPFSAFWLEPDESDNEGV